MAALPVEILLLIFSCFQFSAEVDDHGWDGDSYLRYSIEGTPPQLLATLNSISQASRQFHDLATPFLYRKLHLDHHANLSSLFKTFGHWPHLGRMVTELHLLLTPNSYYARSKFAPYVANARLSLGLPKEIEDGIFEGLLQGDREVCHDAMQAFWLALMPNLRVLALAAPEAPTLVSAVIRHAVKSQRLKSKQFQTAEAEEVIHFSSLREVRLQQGNPGLDLAQIGNMDSLFELPSLRMLRGSSGFWTKHPEYREYLMPILQSGLQHVHLENVTISIAAIKSLLSNCVDLQTLRVRRMIFRNFPLNCDELGDILRAHGGKLKKLDIELMPHQWREDLDEESTDDELELNTFGRLGSLRRMGSLKHLRISLQNLIGHDDYEGDYEARTGLTPTLKLAEVLPASLESIDIHSSTLHPETFKDEVLGMIRCKRLWNLCHADLPPVFRNYGGIGCQNFDQLGWIHVYGKDRDIFSRRGSP